MQAPALGSRVFQFGVFEADLQGGELRKNGGRVKLAGQPFEVLALLLQRPGQVVTREALKQKLWPADTFVDFDNSLNAAINKLREALADSADTPRFVETLPRRGYRFIYPVEAVEGTAPARTRRVKWYVAYLVLAATGLVMALNPGGLRDRLLGRPLPGEITSIAVLPLENLSGDPEQEYFADGVTDALITELGKISALRVISRTSVMRYKAARKSIPEIARELKVDALVEGSVVHAGGRVRVTAKLLRASREQQLWMESYERDVRDVLVLQAEMARTIASEINIRTTPQEQARLSRARPVSPEAQQAYLLGVHHEAKTNPEDVRRAYRYLETAVKLDPNHAHAWACLAHIYAEHAGWLESSEKDGRFRPDEWWSKAEQAARRALAIDASVILASLTLAQVLIRRDWNWLEAERELRRAEEVAPNTSDVQTSIARYLTSMGRHQEALSYALRAIELAPTDPSPYFITAEILYNARRYEESLKYARLATEVEPTHRGGIVAQAQAYRELGRYSDALQVLGGGRRKATGPRPVLGHLYAKMGRRPEALRVLKDTKNPFFRAIIYMGLGQDDEALGMLRQAYEERIPSMEMTLKVDPIWDPLRSDPRFQDLLRRMNFPPDPPVPVRGTLVAAP